MKKSMLLVALLMAATTATAQVDGWLPEVDSGWIDQSNFDQFKQQAEKSFDDFRDSANARFARALAGKWTPFEVSKPMERPHKPEPTTPPIAPKSKGGNPRQPVPEKLPAGLVQPPPLMRPPEPRQLPVPSVPLESQVMEVPFYRQDVAVEAPLSQKLSQCTMADNSEGSVSRFWQALTKSGLDGCVKRLLLQQSSFNLNDWAMYDMTCRVAAKLFGDADRQVATTVFLLNQMEYDARIARTTKGLACMLVMDCTVYAVPFVTMEGKRYYLFMPGNGQRDLEGNVYTYTCTFDYAHLVFDMDIVSSPKFSQRQPSAPYRYKGITMPVNLNLVDFYANYPQVEMTVYANADVDKTFRDQVERAFRPLVKGKDGRSAVATLLNYMHYGFEYATDDEQFGYEKPFFCEENFYYPKNDCEDRSILFSYLVRYLLGLDVILLEYPNHIATAVCFPCNDVKGDYYMVDGKRYVVCDPTYIGADIGMTQPDYREVKAEIIRLRPL